VEEVAIQGYLLFFFLQTVPELRAKSRRGLEATAGGGHRMLLVRGWLLSWSGISGKNRSFYWGAQARLALIL